MDPSDNSNYLRQREGYSDGKVISDFSLEGNWITRRSPMKNSKKSSGADGSNRIGVNSGLHTREMITNMPIDVFNSNEVMPKNLNNLSSPSIKACHLMEPTRRSASPCSKRVIRSENLADFSSTYDRSHLAPGSYNESSAKSGTYTNFPPAPASPAYSKCSLGGLMNRHQLPKHLQFNPYINTGYRPLLSAWDCVMSLFYLHNETVNIITHAIPMVYIFIMWKTMVPWDEIKVPILPWTHLMSCISPWIGSTIYHVFMNHRAGESCYRTLLHLDMFGIWITQSFGALTTVYSSVSCMSAKFIFVVLAVYCLVSIICLYKASTARNPWQRRFCFTLPVLMRAGALYVRLSASGGGNPDAFKHIILQDFLAVLGGFVGAMRIPEKWIPGRLDMVANSHHIMHVVVVWAVYHLHQGAILDLVWLSKNPQCHGLMNPQSLL